MSINLSTDGDWDKLIEDLSRLADAQNSMHDALVETANEIQDAAREYAYEGATSDPGRRTGALADGIQVQDEGDDVSVVSTAPEGPFIENGVGTRYPHGAFLHWVFSWGQEVFALAAAGFEGRHFMERAAQDHIDTLMSLLAAKLREILS